MRLELVGYRAEDGGPPAWEVVHRLVTAVGAHQALWADLDGLQLGPLPAQMPTATRLWAWTTGQPLRLWRIVPYDRPDRPAVAAVSLLTEPTGSAADVADGVQMEVSGVDVEASGPIPLTVPVRRRLQNRAAGLRTYDADTPVPVRFLRLEPA